MNNLAIAIVSKQPTQLLPEQKLTCAYDCRKHSIGEEISEQLEIAPMQIRVIKHVCREYACRGGEPLWSLLTNRLD